MPSTIKNILFDFGGVILDIHHKRVEKAFIDLGVSNFEQLFNQANQSNLFQDFEKGLVSPQDFRDRLRELTKLTISNDLLDESWNQILGGYPPHRIDLLKGLAGKYRLFILSNTNIIHYNFYQDLFIQKFGFGFNSLFEKTYWSFDIGMRKPDPDPFQYIFAQSEIDASETLFIDDSLQNIEIAHKLGMPSYWLREGEEFSDLCEKGSFKENIKYYNC